MAKKQVIKDCEAYNEGINDQTLGTKLKAFDWSFWRSEIIFHLHEQEKGSGLPPVETYVLRDTSKLYKTIAECMKSENWGLACLSLAYMLHQDDPQVPPELKDLVGMGLFSAKVMFSHGNRRYMDWKIYEHYKRIVQAQKDWDGEQSKKNKLTNAIYQWRILLNLALQKELKAQGLEFDLIPIEKVQFSEKVGKQEPDFEDSNKSTDDVLPEGSKHRAKLEDARGKM